MKTLTENHKNNIRKAMTGRHHSLETRKKMSLAQKGVRVGNKNANWKGGRNKLKSGYVHITLPHNSPFIVMCNGRDHCIPEHRYVIAKHLNRCLESWEVVHHINHIRDDNRIENLSIIDGRKHSGFHLEIKLLLKRIKKLEQENSIL